MPQTNLKKARARAAKLGVVVRPSIVKGKKLDVLDPRGRKLASIGDIRYEDFLQHGDHERRRLYKARHQKNRSIVGSPGYFADQILW